MTATHHNGEKDGDGRDFLDQPQHDEAAQLADGEQVDPGDRNLAQVGEVRLVLLRHEELKQEGGLGEDRGFFLICKSVTECD